MKDINNILAIYLLLRDHKFDNKNALLEYYNFESIINNIPLSINQDFINGGINGLIYNWSQPKSEHD